MINSGPYIGGNFELDLEVFSAPPQVDLTTYFELGDEPILVNSGRAGLGVVLDALPSNVETIWLPDYMCGDSILPRLHERGLAYQLFSVNIDLSVDEAALLDGLGSAPAAVLLINYFGLCDFHKLADRVRAQSEKAILILDNVQALYDRVGRRWADFTFASFRKFWPVPDGGYVTAASGITPPLEPAPSPDGRQAFLSAAALRQLHVGGHCVGDLKEIVEETYLKLFDMSSAGIVVAPAAMSTIAIDLAKRLPLDSIAQRRVANYEFLSSALRTVAGVTIIRPDLEKGMVPLCLPALTPADNRDSLVRFLRGRGIFCPVHWPVAAELADHLSPQAAELAARVFSIPIDQRYEPDQLERVVLAIQEFEKVQ